MWVVGLREQFGNYKLMNRWRGSRKSHLSGSRLETPLLNPIICMNIHKRGAGETCRQLNPRENAE